MENSKKTLLFKFSCCILLTAALSFFQFSKKRISFDFNIYSIIEPLYKIIYYPNKIRYKLRTILTEKSQLYAIQEDLFVENLVLKSRLQKLNFLEQENEKLRELLNATQDFDFAFQLSEIINISVNPYSHQIVINKGLNDDVYRGQPILNQQGVVGQVTSVSLNQSVVTLITSPNQSVPVIVLRNGLRAVIKGARDSLDQGSMSIDYIGIENDIQEGDVLVTSGLGNVYPQGYPIAKIILREENANQPFLTLRANPVTELNQGGHVILVWTSQKKNNNLNPDKDSDEKINPYNEDYILPMWDSFIAHNQIKRWTSGQF